MKTLALLLFLPAVLWVAACAHSGSRQTAKNSAPRTPNSEQGQPAAQQTREKSEVVNKAVPQAASSAQKEDGKNTASQAPDLKTSAPAGGPVQRALPAGAVAVRLEEAREKLHVSEVTEKRIAAQLDQLKKSGKASSEDIRNYETYLDSVRGLVAENRKIVARMQAAYAGRPMGMKNSASAGGAHKAMATQSPGQQIDDEVKALDRQLNASLDEFDGVLLKQMDEIRAESADTMRDLAQQAAEAAERLRKNGAAADTSANRAQKAPSTKPSEDSRSDQETAGSATASGNQSSRQGPGAAASKQRRAGYEDDDIVARQLREAAEKETDPELKKKLWEEYDQYKKNQR